mgnify:FL=1
MEIGKKIIVVSKSVKEEGQLENSLESFNEEEQELIRTNVSKKVIYVSLIIPAILYLIVCSISQISVFNIEGITGGLLRVATGALAYTSLEILITIGVLNFLFKTIAIRLNPNKNIDSSSLDFLQEYFKLDGWQRIRVDLFIASGLLLLVLANTLMLLMRIPLV